MTAPKNVFHDHLDHCAQCRENPFDLCVVGQIRLRQQVDAEAIENEATWNTCPDCYRKWRDATPTPGLLHRTRRCSNCADIAKGLKF